jgi:peptide/nickel transport system ATP-binding protein
MSEILKLTDLKVHYPIRSGFFNRITDNVRAVDGVNITLAEGETAGLVGESGSGKTTIGKTIVGLENMTSGKMTYLGQDVSKKSTRDKIKYNKDVQMIYQDAMSSLNPRKNIYDIIAEPIRNFEKLDKNAEEKRIHQLLDIVGLPKRTLSQYPFQFSGGQRQRIGIARAVATNPKLIVADEPVSALDLSVQAQVLNFMKQIQKDMGIAFLFISHDLGVVRHMTDNIAVMHNGRIVEKGSRDDIFDNPQHIYTKRLLSAIPSTNVEKREENRTNRKRVEQDFEDQKSIYYDEKGRALPLIQVSSTHWAAIPEKGVN